MKSKSFFVLKKFNYLVLVIICFSTYTNAQEKITKNYAGVAAIGEMTRLAVSCGVEYERWLYVKNQLAIGAKAHYIFPSKTLNFFFSSNDLLQRNSQTHIMATSYFFTGRDKEPEGFFLSLGLGVNFIRWSREVYDDTNPNHYSIVRSTDVSPGFDLSLGGQINLGSISTRFTGGLQAFPGQYADFYGVNGTLLLYTKFSIGF